MWKHVKAKDQFWADRKIESCERNHIRTCTNSTDCKGSIIAVSPFYREGWQLKNQLLQQTQLCKTLCWEQLLSQLLFLINHSSLRAPQASPGLCFSLLGGAQGPPAPGYGCTLTAMCLQIEIHSGEYKGRRRKGSKGGENYHIRAFCCCVGIKMNCLWLHSNENLLLEFTTIYLVCALGNFRRLCWNGAGK